MNLVSINANAKVNFSIDVLGFAENGYHLVDMIMQTICVYDRIILYTPEAIPELREDIVSDIMTAKRKHDERIEVLKARGVPIRLPDPSDNIIFTCTNHRLPVDQKNLAYRAALLMKEIAGYKGKLGIHIRKNIPVGGGLGGGSADAAATLVGLNRLFRLLYLLLHIIVHHLQLHGGLRFCLWSKGQFVFGTHDGSQLYVIGKLTQQIGVIKRVFGLYCVFESNEETRQSEHEPQQESLNAEMRQIGPRTLFYFHNKMDEVPL
jgi:4-diphosphocytidyl-2C-methyl-D-erythritol kinase